jgi:hypothetical protein
MLGLSLTRRQATVCGLVAVAGFFLAALGIWLTAWGACAEGGWTEGLWEWSPRMEFCSESDPTFDVIRMSVVLATPALLVVVGGVLWAKVGMGWATAAFILAVTIPPFLPAAYVKSLPKYHTWSTPILYNPYLRAATETRPARACYAYGIVYGPDKRRDADRICVDLEQTPQASALSPDSDSHRGSGLGSLGTELSANGFDEGTEHDGLVVARVYPLSEAEAREGSILIRTRTLDPEF